MNETQAKVCLFVAIFKFKVALLDRVTQTVQTSLRSDRDYNTTIGSVRGYGGGEWSLLRKHVKSITDQDRHDSQQSTDQAA